MKFDPLVFLLFPMLKLTALAAPSLMLKRITGLQAINIRFPTRFEVRSSSSSRLFSSISVDNEGNGAAGNFADPEDSDAPKRTRKAEKTFVGLTRMRLKKVLQKANEGAFNVFFS